VKYPKAKNSGPGQVSEFVAGTLKIVQQRSVQSAQGANTATLAGALTAQSWLIAIFASDVVRLLADLGKRYSRHPPSSRLTVELAGFDTPVGGRLEPTRTSYAAQYKSAFIIHIAFPMLVLARAIAEQSYIAC